MTPHKTPVVEEDSGTVVCWVSQSEGYVFDVAEAYVEPTLIYSHAVIDGEREGERPPREVVRTLRNKHGYTLR